MVSALSPQNFGRSEQVDLVGSYLGGQRMAQGNQLQQQAIRQNEQQISRADYEQGVQRLMVMGKLAEKARSLPLNERYAFAQSINPEMLQSVGIDPKTVSTQQLDNNSLDSLIELARANSPFNPSMNRVQSSKQYKNGTTQQTLSGGQVRVIDPSGKEVEGEEARRVIDEANKYEISASIQKAGGAADARNQSDLTYIEDIELGRGRGQNTTRQNDRENVRQEEAAANYPKLESQVNDSIRLIDELLEHPGRNMATGATAWVPSIPGTKQAGFISRFDQIKGQSFLQAFESLKGGGAITEVEGKVATQAINRMNRATSQSEFDSAANDLKGVLARAKETMAKKAKPKESSTGSTSSPAQIKIGRFTVEAD